MYTIAYYFFLQCILVSIDAIFSEISLTVVSSQHIQIIVWMCWEETTLRLISLIAAEMHWTEN